MISQLIVFSWTSPQLAAKWLLCGRSKCSVGTKRSFEWKKPFRCGKKTPKNRINKIRCNGIVIPKSDPSAHQWRVPCSFLTDSSFPDRFNETKMGKEWDLPRGKLAHCPHLKVQGVSVTKSLSELFILILWKEFLLQVFFCCVGKTSSLKQVHFDTWVFK